MKKINLRDMCSIGIFAATIAVMALISIPLPSGVPITMQTLAIMLAGIILGPKKGALAVLVYVAIGAAGVPVFSGFKGGVAVITGMTGGFIMSFPLLALIVGFGDSFNGRIRFFLCLVSGVLVNYLCGMLWFMFIAQSNLWIAFTACVLPWLPTDALKIIIAAAAGRQIKSVLTKAKVLI